jgi:hypothetical protein
MSNLVRQHTRRRRARNAVAVSVIWAGLAGGAVVDDHVAAAAPAPQVTGDTSMMDHQAALAQAGLLTAAPVPVHGTADDGSELIGMFQLRRFQAQGGVLYAVGDVTGTLGSGQVSRRNVRLPVGAASTPQAAGPEGLQAVPTPGACSILSLDLGPLDLNLLGLRVALDEVVLLIEAVPGAGELLGNLLCAVAGLLDGGLGGALAGLLGNLLAAIANLLNGLLAV